MRHDAKQCRASLESERLRIALGLLTPEERQAQAAADQKRKEAGAKAAAKGPALFPEENP